MLELDFDETSQISDLVPENETALHILCPIKIQHSTKNTKVTIHPTNRKETQQVQVVC